MALPLILLAALAAAEPAVVDAPKIPGRYELPTNTTPEVDSVPAGHPHEKLEALVLKRPTTKARLDALEVVGDRSRITVYPKDKAAYFRDGHRCADLLGKVLALESDDAFRRWAAFRLFACCGSSARDLVALHPLDRRWEKLWLRFDALLARLIRDQDDELAHYFERYQQPDPIPDWRVEKKLAQAGHDKLLAAHPDFKKVLNEAWELCESVQRSQQATRTALSPSSRLAGKLEREDLDFLDAADASVPDLRIYAVWSNLYPRVARDLLGEDELEKAGLAVQPLRLGWPDFRSLIKKRG